MDSLTTPLGNNNVAACYGFVDESLHDTSLSFYPSTYDGTTRRATNPNR